MIIQVQDRTLIKMLTGSLIFNTGCLIDAMLTIRKYQKTCDQWKKNHEYMKKFVDGLSEIAINPSADPIANREAVDLLIDNLRAEILLEEVDFEPTLEAFKDE